MPKQFSPSRLWAVAGTCALAAIYPYVVYPAILSVLRPRAIAKTGIPSDGGREFALLFCAYNEEKAMPAKIEN